MPKQFTHLEFADVLNATVENLKKLSSLKGAEYSGDNDRLLNFRRGGERMSIPMEVTWWIYANKHWDAITQACEDKQTGSKRQRLEGLAGRCDDLIVYLLLFKCMLLEAERPEITHTEKREIIKTTIPDTPENRTKLFSKMKPIIEPDSEGRFSEADGHQPKVAENPSEELKLARQRAVDSMS